MNKLVKLISLLSIISVTGLVSAQEGGYLEGSHYVRLDPVVPPVTDDKARHEVVELFWYGCSHCFDFEPYVGKWKESKAEDVTFVRVPAIFNARWEQHARAYYSLELMGELERGHELLFSGIHEQGRGLNNVDAMARYFAANGIDESKFREGFNSFAVEAKINRAKELIRQYQVTGVPSIIIDGTYKTSASSAGGYAQLVEIIEGLTANSAE